MNLFEYEAKELFLKHGIPVPKGFICKTPLEVEMAYQDLQGDAVLKVQVLLGGRGKAGGIKFPSSLDEARILAEKLFSTPFKGIQISQILVEERLNISHEFYLSITPGTSRGCPLLVFSPKGGIEIEELAATSPDLIKKVYIDPRYGLFGHAFRFTLGEANVPRSLHDQLIQLAQKLYRLYWDLDAELAEINPLVLTSDGRLIAADAKLRIDDSALFRHPELPRRTPKTVEERAKSLGLSYVTLDGDIGILSNGAGLTMATMDQIELAGGKPANFLDCGQRIIENGVWDGLNLILENPRVRVILINVFGGGVRCDIIAEKIVQAVERLEQDSKLSVDVIVCLQGRNMEEGKYILSKCMTKRLRQASTVEEAVKLAVDSANYSNLR